MFGWILAINSKLRAVFRQTIRFAFLALSPWGSPARSFIVGNRGGALLLVDPSFFSVILRVCRFYRRLCIAGRSGLPRPGRCSSSFVADTIACSRGPAAEVPTIISTSGHGSCLTAISDPRDRGIAPRSAPGFLAYIIYYPLPILAPVGLIFFRG